MRRITKHSFGSLLFLLLAVATTLVCPEISRASICDMPVFILRGGVEANVMILLDNSHSMNTAVYHENYDPDTVYAGTHTADAWYYVNVAQIYTINSRDAFLVTGPNGMPGIYEGNYLNWIYWVAADDDRTGIPELTRLDQAQIVLHDFIDRTDNVTFGLTVFNNDDGANIVCRCGTDKATIMNEVDNVVADAWSPLAEAMEDMVDYFMETGGDAPFTADCQKSFLVVITDGYPTMDLDISPYLWDTDGDGNEPGDCTSIGAPYDNAWNCSDHADDVSYFLSTNDLRPDLVNDPQTTGQNGQNVATFCIGLGLEAPLLEDIAKNGDGLFMPVYNEWDLLESLESIMTDIMLRVAAGSAVAVVSSESEDMDYLYRAKFNPLFWAGYLEAFALPYSMSGQPVWEAGDLLADRSADDRTMFTAIGTNVYNFVAGNAGDLQAAMGVAELDTTEMIIDWTRGENASGAAAAGGGGAAAPEPIFRVRQYDWKLGDIIRSTPMVIGNPTFFLADSDWQAFVNGESGREKVIYVGANDGQLHCFRAEDGYEKWAFVPESSLPLLKEMADPDYCHLFSVDLPIVVKDLQLNGTWRTCLASGMGQGGSSYFALDVTDPDTPLVLWQATLTQDLPFGSEVRFTHINGQAVALIGSGFDEIDGEAWVHEYDMETGALLGSLLLSADNSANNRTTAVSIIDVNLDNSADYGYVGDLQGTCHRIAFNKSTNPDDWDVTALYSGTQPITAQPMPALAETGEINVYFGTGMFFIADHIDDVIQQSFICVFDRGDGAENPILVDQTGATQDIGNADGWFFDLIEEVGERVIEPAAIVAGSVFFTSFAPNPEPCMAGGDSWLYKVDYEDGTDMEEDGDEAGKPKRMYRGGGVSSRPVIDIFNETVVIQNSNMMINIEDIGEIFLHLNVKSWQENFERATANQDSVVQ